MQESEVQAEYDNVLREAKLLRLDLQHALTKCLEHKVVNTQPCKVVAVSNHNAASMYRICTAVLCSLLLCKAVTLAEPFAPALGRCAGWFSKYNVISCFLVQTLLRNFHSCGLDFAISRLPP